MKTNSTLFKKLQSHFSSVSRDCPYFDPDRVHVKPLYSRDRTKTILVAYPRTRDTRRITDPLDLDPIAGGNFHTWTKNPTHRKNLIVHHLSMDSKIVLSSNPIKAVMYSDQVCPEPFVVHYCDMMRLAFALKTVPTLFIVNLPGSGASVPQHFHTQLFPLLCNGAENSLTHLLRNLEPESGLHTLQSSNRVTVQEIRWPLWGLRFNFPESMSSAGIGTLLYNSLHRDIRYRSQLQLSYNLYLDSRTPRIVTALFRYSNREVATSLPQIAEIILKRNSDFTSLDDILKSDNHLWRWAWLESAGGLLLRNDRFFDIKTFSFSFWNTVYRRLQLYERHKNAIRKVLYQI